MCNFPKHHIKLLRVITSLLILWVTFLPLQAQPEDKSIQATEAERYLRERGEVYFRFVLPPSFSLSRFSAGLSISRMHADTVYACANALEFRQFVSEGLPYTVLVPPSLTLPLPRFPKEKATTLYNKYVTYPEYVSILQQFAAKHPGICRLRQFGTTPGGHGLYVLKISDQPDTDEDEPAFFYSSSMHGDELAGYILMLQFAEHLLENYETDSRIRAMVNNLEIWINPLLNPDGAYFTSDSTVFGATRYNSAHVDLNRDFPDIQDADTSGDDRQPETLAMMRLLEEIRPVLGANFHGGIEVVNYPWDTWSRLHPDDEWYRTLSRTYADTVHNHSPEGYMVDLDNGITNGYNWYQVLGGRQDYVNYFLHGREITVELSTAHTPPEEDLDDYWEFNYRSLLDFVEQTFQGFSATVTDSLTHDPLPATAVLLGHDWDNSFVETNPSTGRLYRLLLPGTYYVSISSPGYHTRNFRVGVAEKNMTDFDVRLYPEIISVLYPNPFSNSLQVYLYGHGDELTLEFTDMTGRFIQRVVQPVVYTGLQTIAVKPMAPGLYITTLRYHNTYLRKILFRE